LHGVSRRKRRYTRTFASALREVADRPSRPSYLPRAAQNQSRNKSNDCTARPDDKHRLFPPGRHANVKARAFTSFIERQLRGREVLSKVSAGIVPERASIEMEAWARMGRHRSSIPEGSTAAVTKRFGERLLSVPIGSVGLSAVGGRPLKV